MMAHFKEENPCNTVTDISTFNDKIFVNLDKKSRKMAKIEKKILLKICFKFSRKLIRNLKKSFCYGVKQLFPFEMSPNTTM